jgi:hypothetical protein
MNLNDLLPTSGLPLAENHRSDDGKWSFGDSEQVYRSKGGHPLYNEFSIDYTLNSMGYRCPEFDVRADIRMVSIGCSHTFGVGLPQSALYHELFAERLKSELNVSVVNWNLGCGAVSNNYISRMLHLAVPILQPDLTLIFFTHLSRREYIAANNRALKFLPRNLDHMSSPVLKVAAGYLLALSSKYDDKLQFFRDYKSIESLLRNRLWLYSIIRPSEIEDIASHLSSHNRAKDFDRVDVARDHMHLGPDTHRNIYRNLWDTFMKLDGIQQLRKTTPATVRSVP